MKTLFERYVLTGLYGEEELEVFHRAGSLTGEEFDSLCAMARQQKMKRQKRLAQNSGVPLGGAAGEG